MLGSFYNLFFDDLYVGHYKIVVSTSIYGILIAA